MRTSLILLVLALALSAGGTPPGAPWPHGWSHQIDLPEEIVVGEPFVVTVSLTAVLFDVPDVEVKPVVWGDGLKIVDGATPWKGELKKGEAKEFRFTVVASREGPDGQAGIWYETPAFYPRLREYISAQTSGPYASGPAKEFILREIDIKERAVREGMFGGVGAKAGFCDGTGVDIQAVRKKVK